MEVALNYQCEKLQIIVFFFGFFVLLKVKLQKSKMWPICLQTIILNCSDKKCQKREVITLLLDGSLIG